MQKVNIKRCNCSQCRHHYRTQNKPGMRDSKRKWKSSQNPERVRQWKRWIKKLRQQKGEDIYSPQICGYTD